MILCQILNEMLFNAYFGKGKNLQAQKLFLMAKKNEKKLQTNSIVRAMEGKKKKEKKNKYID